jgi:hypothetical protein
VAKLPTFKRILPEQFPDLKWLPEFVAPINKFMSEVQDAMNNKLTFQENMNAEVRTVLLDGTYPIKLKWSKPNKPTAAWIGQAREVSGNHTTITTALYLDWEYTTEGNFQINNVAGLSASPTDKFNLTILIITG